MLTLERNKIKLSNALLVWVFFIFFGLIISEVAFAACVNVPISGAYPLDSSCTFSGTVDGVEEGNIIVAEGATLTINAGQTVVWNPGYSIVINGSIAINKSGGQLRKAYLWYIDAEEDGYPDTLDQIAAAEAPESGVRRSNSVFTEKWTYVSQVTLAACGPGYYRPADACIEVGLGYYSPDQDNDRYECGGNDYYCPIATNAAPTAVSSGYYSTGGTASTRTGQSQCVAGTYCTSGVQYSASIGYYVPSAGATSQTGCSAGTYTGSTGQTSCATCTAGYRCPGSSDRIACVAGNYQPDTGQSSCVSASAGYYVSGTTATSQTECGGNDYYCPGTGNTGPITVSSGYYSTGGTASTRTGQSICEAGNYCVSGVKYACGTCKSSSESATSCYNVAAGTSGYGCTATHYRCNGSGSCTAPLVYPCVRPYWNQSGTAACSDGGYLGCSGGYFSLNCTGDAYGCAGGYTCNGGLCSAKCWEYQYDNGKTYGCVNWGWNQTGQTACTANGWGGFIGVHAWVSGCSGSPQAYYSSCGDEWCGTVTCWRK